MNKRGFTLLEIVISIAIFSLGIVSAFALALFNMNKTKENYHEVRAAHLAREGIELVRSVRDSNWLKYQSNYDCGAASNIQFCEFNEGLDKNFIVMDYSTTTPTEVCNGLTFDQCLSGDSVVGVADNACINGNDCTLYLKNNFYTHDKTEVTLDSEVARIMRINNICFDGATEYVIDGSDTCGADTLIGLEVTSRVRWISGRDYEVLDIVTNIYDWRY